MGLKDHCLLMHHEDNLLYHLYVSIRKMIVQENIMIDLKLVDMYFLAKCPMCNMNFPSQAAVKIHEKLCLSKFVTSCAFFGNRLTHDVFSCKYVKEKSEEEDQLRAINQASLFLKRASASSSSKDSATTSATTTATSTTSTVTSTTIKTNETFEQYLSKTYGEFLLKKSSPSKHKHKDGTSKLTTTFVEQESTPKMKKPPPHTTSRKKDNPAKAFLDSEA